MKIMVTGGAGYVGGTTAALLAQQGHQVVIVDNLCHAQRELVPSGVDFVEADIADRPTIESLFREATAASAPFDGVLHFAALIEAGESMQKPEIYFRNNTASTLALLEAILAAGPKRFVFSSTAAVYGEPEAVPIPETASLRPTNAYGESKLLVEHILGWFHRVHGLRSASLRYFNVAGAPETGAKGSGVILRGEAHEPESHLIPLILDVALGRRAAIKIFGDDYPTHDGTCVRDYVHVSDLADAHILALEALETPAAADHRLIYNLGNGAGFTVKEVIDSFAASPATPSPSNSNPAAPATQPSSSPAPRKPSANSAGSPTTPKSTKSSKTAWIWHQKRHVS